jgi:hypothetical protein
MSLSAFFEYGSSAAADSGMSATPAAMVQQNLPTATCLHRELNNCGKLGKNELTHSILFRLSSPKACLATYVLTDTRSTLSRVLNLAESKLSGVLGLHATPVSVASQFGNRVAGSSAAALTSWPGTK